VRILFVSAAGILRGPMAEGIMRTLVRSGGRDDIEVSSAGVVAVEGTPADEAARRIAGAAGFDLSNHRSCRPTGAMLGSADSIVVMEAAHLSRLAGIDPGSASRSCLLSEHAPPRSGVAQGDDIPAALAGDEGSITRSFRIVRQCVEALWRSLPAPPEEIYTRTIEERFRRYRKAPLSLSPADWDVIDRWWKEGVPLWVVLQSLDETFARRQTPAAGRARRLSYFIPDVAERYEAFGRSRIPGAGAGAGPGEGEATPGHDLDDLRCAASARLSEASARARDSGQEVAAGLLEAAARQARDLGPADDPPALIRALDGLERRLVSDLREAMDGDRLEKIRNDAAGHLSPHRDRMSPRAFEDTVSRFVDKTVREIYGVPCLTAP